MKDCKTCIYYNYSYDENFQECQNEGIPEELIEEQFVNHTGNCEFWRSRD
jgi:hypothetical protein